MVVNFGLSNIPNLSYNHARLILNLALFSVLMLLDEFCNYLKNNMEKGATIY